MARDTGVILKPPGIAKSANDYHNSNRCITLLSINGVHFSRRSTWGPSLVN